MSDYGKLTEAGFDPLIGQVHVSPHRNIFAVTVVLTQYVKQESMATELLDAVDGALVGGDDA